MVHIGLSNWHSLITDYLETLFMSAIPGYSLKFDFMNSAILRNSLSDSLDYLVPSHSEILTLTRPLRLYLALQGLH